MPSNYLCTATKEVPGLGSVDWTANTLAFIKDNKINLHLQTYQDTIDKFQREHLGFNNVEIIANKKIEIYDVDNFQKNTDLPFGAYGRLLADGDVADGFWTIDMSKTNYIRMTKIDLDKRIVEGEFDVHFRMKTQSTNGTLYSERINFKSGKFVAEIAK